MTRWDISQDIITVLDLKYRNHTTLKYKNNTLKKMGVFFVCHEFFIYL